MRAFLYYPKLHWRIAFRASWSTFRSSFLFYCDETFLSHILSKSALFLKIAKAFVYLSCEQLLDTLAEDDYYTG